MTADLSSFVGRVAAPPRTAPTPVSESAIRAWCVALGDGLPTYRDAAFAGGIVAPPAMLQAWTLHDRREVQPAPGPEHAEAELMAALAELGYRQLVATNCEQTYVRPLRPGDVVTSQATIVAVAGPKRTALGEGWFVTTEIAFRDADGEVVGTMLSRLLRYRAERSERSPEPPARPEISSDPIELVGRSDGPVVTETRRAADVAVGEELPALELLVTPTLVITGALASNDFNVLHHDRDRAVAAGSPDIFMNILTTNGLVCRFLTEWAGPRAVVRSIAIRLGAPNYPYDTFRLTGTVTELADGAATIAFRGANSVGDHVTGTATVELP